MLQSTTNITQYHQEQTENKNESSNINGQHKQNGANGGGGGTRLTTTDRTKAWLARYGNIVREIALLEARADALRTRATSPASPTLDGMPRAPGFAGDRIGGMVGAIDHIEQEVKEKRREAAVVYNEIDAALHRLSGPHAAERRTVLQCRYLDLLMWADVAFLLFGDRADFNEKEESFSRRVFNIHKAALKDLAAALAL